MSCIITEDKTTHIKKVKFEWVSAADGTASGTTNEAYTGQVVRLVTIPGAAALAPTDNYDISIADEDLVDILMSAGANRDTLNTEQVLAASLGCVVNDKLTISITNAGDAKSGTTIVYFK